MYVLLPYASPIQSYTSSVKHKPYLPSTAIDSSTLVWKVFEQQLVLEISDILWLCTEIIFFHGRGCNSHFETTLWQQAIGESRWQDNCSILHQFLNIMRNSCYNLLSYSANSIGLERHCEVGWSGCCKLNGKWYWNHWNWMEWEIKSMRNDFMTV